MGLFRERLLISADRYESLVAICAFVVFVGLAFEVIEIWHENRHRKWMPVLMKLLPTVLITGGVFGEFWFGLQTQRLSAEIRGIDDKNVADSQRTAAQAKIRLAQTEIELTKLRMSQLPRMLSFRPEKLTEYLNSKKIGPVRKIIILYKRGDTEAQSLANFIDLGLHFSKWLEPARMGLPADPQPAPSEPPPKVISPFGGSVTVIAKEFPSPSSPAGIIAAGITAAGVRASAVLVPFSTKEEIVIFVDQK